MADKKVIAVLGATGAQGGGLVRAILADTAGPFTARAITRDVTSDKAKALAAAGAEVVAADVDDEASLVKAFAGAHGAFCVTFFWAHFSPERELAEAAAMARTIKAAGMSHAIWSTLEDTRKFIPLDDDRMPTLMGKYKVPHFDAKGEADAFFLASGVPTTLLLHLVLLGQLHLLRVGTQAGPRRHAGADLPDGIGQVAGDRLRGHRPVGLRDLQGWPAGARPDDRHRGRSPHA